MCVCLLGGGGGIRGKPSCCNYHRQCLVVVGPSLIPPPPHELHACMNIIHLPALCTPAHLTIWRDQGGEGGTCNCSSAKRAMSSRLLTSRASLRCACLSKCSSFLLWVAAICSGVGAAISLASAALAASLSSRSLCCCNCRFAHASPSWARKQRVNVSLSLRATTFFLLGRGRRFQLAFRHPSRLPLYSFPLLLPLSSCSSATIEMLY